MGGQSTSKKIKNSTCLTEDIRPKYFQLLKDIQAEEKRIKEEQKNREKRNADRLAFERIESSPNYFQKNGGNKRLSMRGGIVETFGPWPFALPKRELKPGKQADILFVSKAGSSKFASWSNSTSGHVVLVIILLLDVALGLNAYRLRRKQHAKLLE